LILRQASPFFHSLFTLPQPPDSKATPIVPMEEDSKVLHTLIRLIYPVRYKLSIDNLPFATRLLRAAIKLQIECAIDPIRESTTQLLRKEPNPLRAWALAKHLGNKEAEEEAVLRYIKCDTPSLLRMRVAEMRSIDALDYFDLMKRREDALQEAETAIENTVWACSRCRGTPAWRRCYEDAIAGLNPFSGDVASDQLFELSAYRSGCTNCVDSIHDRNRRPVSVSPSDLRARLGEILLKYSP
ncbi:uncharacterized protein EI90DRAFT_3036041, partial [Cantharellus anzutake]|uniref:uncharacterized protein n=1 Tax=Cantharellus anzutake TaxID=1750568 RepID=UPI0019031966